MPNGRYELVITKGESLVASPPKYRRYFATFQKAEEYAFEFGAQLDLEEGNADRDYVIYGPCCPEGRTVRGWV